MLILQCRIYDIFRFHTYIYTYAWSHTCILLNHIYIDIDVTLILMWTFATARCILYHCTDHGPHLHFCLQVGTGEVSSQFEWYHPPLQAADVAANFSACDRQNRGWLRNLTETYGDNKVLSRHIFKCATCECVLTNWLPDAAKHKYIYIQ